MPLIKIGDYSNGTPIDRDEWTRELSNMYDTWNGKNTTNDVHHKFSHATIPALIIDQIGSGLIWDGRQSSISKCPFLNNGKISNDNVIARKYAWFFNFSADPFDGSNPQLGVGWQKYLIIPNGVGMRITKFSLLFSNGAFIGGPSDYPGTNIVFKLNIGGNDVGSGVRIGSGNNTENNEYSEALNESISANTKVRISNPTLSNANLTSLVINILVEWEQKLG